MYGVGVRGVLNGMTKRLTGVPPVSCFDMSRCLQPLETQMLCPRLLFSGLKHARGLTKGGHTR